MKLHKITAFRQPSSSSAASEHAVLMDCLHSARQELRDADSLFNELSDGESVDYASYRLLAARAKYSYLIKLAKEKKISL